MVRRKTRYARVWALALACLGVGLAVCGAQVAPPKVVDLVGKASNQGTSVDPQSLQANGQPDARALRSQILQMQAEGIADKLAQFIKEMQNEVGWTTQPQLTPSIDQRRLDALRLLRQAPAITELSLLDPQGKEYLKVSRMAMDVVGSGTDYSKETKFTETVARNIYYGPVYVGRESEPHMTLGLASGRYGAGVSVVELSLKPMREIVQHTKVGDRGVAYVVNTEGRIIAHPDFGVGKSLRDLSTLDQVREARTTASVGSARITRDMNDREVVATYAPVKSTGWLVLVELPVEEWTKN